MDPTPDGGDGTPPTAELRGSGDSMPRAQWQNRAGFILAAAGAAIGLGNIWKFPFITGQNGGGAFVLIYLVCIALVGLPVMISEIIIGRAAQKSPVSAYEGLSQKKTMWSVVGWMGVAAGFILLSYYSVVAGWAMKYIEQTAGGSYIGKSAAEIGALFGGLAGDFGRSIFWHTLFMSLTVVIVLAGVRRGIETGVRIMMPLLLALMVGLMVYAGTTPGFGKALDFVFMPHTENLHAGGVLEALGHSFFTLSVGVGGLITYGSYLGRKDDIPFAAGAITLLRHVRGPGRVPGDVSVSLCCRRRADPGPTAHLHRHADRVQQYSCWPDSGPGLLRALALCRPHLGHLAARGGGLHGDRQVWRSPELRHAHLRRGHLLVRLALG